jgi:hypothetical protein
MSLGERPALCTGLIGEGKRKRTEGHPGRAR